MTTVIFYKGLMGTDSLQTTKTNTNKIEKFNLVEKTYVIKDSNSKEHLIALTGQVPAIKEFIKHYQDLKNFKPIGDFSALDWDGENLVSWCADDRISWFGMIIGLITFNEDRGFKKILRKHKHNYNKDEECIYILGSGQDFAGSAYEKLRFQFKRKKEKMEDHLTREEVIEYLIKIASRQDVFTNDKILLNEFTSVSPQLAKLSKG